VLNATNAGIPLALTIIERTGATYGEPAEWATQRTGAHRRPVSGSSGASPGRGG
jgi:hypothetical protein